MSRPADLSLADDLGCAGQMQEFDVRTMTTQLVAVLAPQCRAAHHPAVAAMLGKPLPDRFEPRITVVVIEGLTGGHAGDAGRSVLILGGCARDPHALCPS